MMDQIFTLEMLGTLFGIAYIILEYRASVWLWPISVVMPAIYITVYYQAGIYADMGINVYYLLASIYGWIIWLKKHRKASHNSSEQNSESGEGIVHTSRKEWLWSGVVFGATFALLAFILINYTPSNVPYCDSFTTALSIIGMWLLAHKRVEHWIVWIVVDIASSLLYFEKGLYPTSALYALYTVIAVGGYIKWLKMIEPQKIITTQKTA